MKLKDPKSYTDRGLRALYENLTKNYGFFTPEEEEWLKALREEYEWRCARDKYESRSL
jgi:hypothetical protein